MKKLFSTRYLTLWCFVLLLGLLLLPNLHPFAGESLRQLRYALAGEGFSLAGVEEGYNARLPGRTAFVTLNGGFRRLLGERAVNERYKLTNGQLTYVIPELDMTGIARSTAAFSEAVTDMGIDFLYVNTPFKLDPADKQLPIGVEDYSNENADRFLAILRENGVETLDLRECEKAEGLDHYRLFFRTDHHWTPETGFWAFTKIVERLTALDAAYAPDARILDPDSYDKTVYPGIFLGSHGRRVGPWYAGTDDMTVIRPLYDTWFHLWANNRAEALEGSYDACLLFPDNLTGDMFQTSSYNVYLGGDFARLYVENNSREKQLDVCSKPRKLLVFKDSFSLVVAPFLALGYDEVVFLDLRLFDSSPLDFIAEEQPDLVMVLYNPGALEDNNWEMFDFIR